MSVTNVIPTILFMAAYVFVAAWIARRISFFRDLTEPTGPSASKRFEALDGLRGFLALLVFFHHAVIYYFYFYRGDGWGRPPSHFYSVIGPVAVGFFFMMTGLLFWNKAIQANGRIAPMKLYINRARRIAPLYLCSVVVCLGLVMWLRGFEFENPPARTFEFFAELFGLGLFELPYINGYKVDLMNAGVLWTLIHEWRFYLLLPLLAFFYTPGRFAILAALLLLAGGFFPDEVRLTFLAGMATAYFAQRPRVQAICRSRWITPLVLLPILFVPWTKDLFLQQSYAFLMFPAFLAIAAGNDLWGLLICRGAKYLGTVSYSLYLLHGIMLTIILRFANKFVPIKTMDPYSYWALVGFTGLVTVAVCGLTYRFIEHPFMSAAKSSKPKLPPIEIPRNSSVAN